MKSIIVLAIALFSLSANAQQAQQDTTTKAINLRMNAAGATMQKGSAHLITGTLMTLVGSALMAYGAQDDQKPLIYIGAATAVVGVGFTFSGFGKIGKAGKQLQYISQ